MSEYSTLDSIADCGARLAGCRALSISITRAVGIDLLVETFEELLTVVGDVKVDEHQKQQQHDKDEHLAKDTVIVNHIENDHCRMRTGRQSKVVNNVVVQRRSDNDYSDDDEDIR